MAEKRENKRYWFLKVDEDYFRSPLIKKLRKMAGGDTYCIIYLKMQLLSLRSQGYIFYEWIEDDIVDELALILDESREDVAATFIYLVKNGLLIEGEGEPDAIKYYLPDTAERIGSITDSSLRSRKSRCKNRSSENILSAPALQCNTNAARMQPNATGCDADENCAAMQHKCSTNASNMQHDSFQNHSNFNIVAMQHDCSTSATNCSLERELEREPDIDIDIEREKEKAVSHIPYRGIMDNVLLDEKQYGKICQIYREPHRLIDLVSTIIPNAAAVITDHEAYTHKIALQEKWPRKPYNNFASLQSEEAAVEVAPMPEELREKIEKMRRSKR